MTSAERELKGIYDNLINELLNDYGHLEMMQNHIQNFNNKYKDFFESDRIQSYRDLKNYAIELLETKYLIDNSVSIRDVCNEAFERIYCSDQVAGIMTDIDCDVWNKNNVIESKGKTLNIICQDIIYSKLLDDIYQYVIDKDVN